MVANSIPPRARYQNILDAPEHMVAEIVDGQVYLQPRPASRHARASSRLGGALDGPFDRGHDGPGGWVILDEPELHLGENILVPDLAGWRHARMPKVPDAPFFTLAPDWICEVLSPNTAKVDRAKKLPAYAREGIQHVWLVDPLAKTLEVLRLVDLGDAWRLVGTWADDAQVRAEPFDAKELDLADLWAGF